MKQIEINMNSIVVKPNRGFLASGILSLFLSCLVLSLLFNGFEPIAPIEMTFADKLGRKICYVFLLLFFGLGFLRIITGSMCIVIDENGVCGKRLFSKKRLLWSVWTTEFLTAVTLTETEKSVFYIFPPQNCRSTRKEPRKR